MGDLLAIAYPGERAVERAPDNLAEGITAGLVDVEHAVVIVGDEDGAFDVRQGLTGVGGAVAGGATWGGVIGLVFLAPCLAWQSEPGRRRCMEERGRRSGYRPELHRRRPPAPRRRRASLRASGARPWIGEGVRQTTAASARSDCQHLANDLDLIVRPRSETARDGEIDQHERPGRAAGRLSARGEAQLLSSRVASTRRRAAR
jgi:hypothetical protein